MELNGHLTGNLKISNRVKWLIFANLLYFRPMLRRIEKQKGDMEDPNNGPV
jgi:hypothetical protein